MKRSKIKKIQEIEMQDDLGLSRKKWNHSMNPILFVILKILALILIPVIYFIYSPLLIVLMLFYISFFFFAILTERRINKSVIRSNHIHIPKFDSAIALIAVVIAVVGVCLDANSNVKQSSYGNLSSTQIESFMKKDDSEDGEFDFKQMKNVNNLSSFVSTLKNLGSMLTGERNVFSSEETDNFSKFGMKGGKDFVGSDSDLKENLNSNFEDIPEIADGTIDAEEFVGNMNNNRKMNMIMEDLPIDSLLSSALSSVNSALIFLTVGSGVFSLLILLVKKKKFDRVINEVIVDAPVELTDEEIDRILSFGEDFVIDESKENQEIRRDEEDDDEEFGFTEDYSASSFDMKDIDDIGKETGFDETSSNEEDTSEVDDSTKESKNIENNYSEESNLEENNNLDKEEVILESEKTNSNEDKETAENGLENNVVEQESSNENAQENFENEKTEENEIKDNDKKS